MQTTSPATRSPARSAIQPARRGTRHGFTLIELFIVVVIIGMLVAMIAPALMGAFRSARDAGVITEIKQLESAITAFKAVYGKEPPSRVVIYEEADEWDTDTANRAIIRGIWPQYNFELDQDLTGDGDTDDQLAMNAGECLVFFLGGIVNRMTDGPPEGFSKNPSQPFLPAATAASREGPFFEFAPDRFVDLDGNFTTGTGPGNTRWGWREYKDSLPGQTKPYLYFSSREGRGYETVTPAPVTAIDGTFIDVYRVFNPSSTTATPNTPGSTTVPPTSFVYPPHKPQSFQIISPGADGVYGKGGVFNPAKPNSWLADVGDYDNLTNIHGGRLKP
jgi:prepilin-type N-terminal cleavage/methylation domain-containing protein